MNDKAATPPEKEDSRPKAEWELYAEKHFQRNFWIGVASSVARMLNFLFYNQKLIIPIYVKSLTKRLWVVGMHLSLHNLGVYVFQAFFARTVGRSERRMRFYLWGCLLQGAAFVSVGLFTLCFAKTAPSLVVVVFLVGTLISAIGIALYMLTFLDFTGRMIPENKRGSFLGWPLVFQALIGVFVILFIKWVLRADKLFPYPLEFSTFWFGACIVVIISGLIFLAIREPVAPVKQKEPLPWIDFFAKGLSYFMTDPKFRWFTINFFLLQLAFAVLPHNVRFITDAMNVDPNIIGNVLMVELVVSVSSFVILGYLGNWFGYRHVIRWCVGLWIPLYLALLFFPSIIRILEGMFPAVATLTLIRVAYYCLYVLQESGASAFKLGQQNYQVTIAPNPEIRPIYLSFPLLATLPTLAASPLYGWVVDKTGSFPLVFGFVIFVLVLSGIATKIMPNDREGRGDRF